MDVTIKWNGTDITTSVISYSRQHKICSGIGSIDLTVEAQTSRSFDPWDEIIIEEESEQVGKYYIDTEEKSAPDGVYLLHAQDGSKRMVDYFISDRYEITYPSSAKYWIELFLTEAGVSYTFDVTGNGAPLAENSQLGLKNVYDEVIGLLQLSGWYMYFDGSGTCHIGEIDLTAGGSPDYVFDDSDLIKTLYRKDDKYLRNRAVVWGSGDATTGQWIFADTSTITPWTRGDGDYRTVVYANPNIKTFTSAYTLAARLLNEFAQIIYTKEIELPGTYGIELGEKIRVESDFMTYDGMVTTLIVEMSKEGLKTTCTLDERCPRLFGFVHWTGYVYVGTKSHGVYRRLLKSTSWENYSTGITELSIVDLSAYDGLLAAVSSGGSFYTRHTQNASWYEYSIPPIMDVSQGSGIMVVSGLSAVACSIDRYTGITGNYVLAFTVPVSGGASPTGIYPTSGALSWITGLTPNRAQLYTHQIYVPLSGQETPEYNITVLDVEALDTGSNVLTVEKYKDGFLTDISTGDDGYWGYYRAHAYGADKTAYYSLPPVTSGVWLEKEYWRWDPYTEPWWGISLNIQANPVITNLVTPSGGYMFYYYSYGTPSGIIHRDTVTKSSYIDEYGYLVYDGASEEFYIANPFDAASYDYADYFYHIDDDNYSFFRYGSPSEYTYYYRSIDINDPDNFTEVDIPAYTGAGTFYYRLADYPPNKAEYVGWSGGNYSIILEFSVGFDLKIIRVDMRDGSYGYITAQEADDNTNIPPDSGDYFDVTPLGESANFIYFGLIWAGASYKNGIRSFDETYLDVSYTVKIITIDKFSGTVSISSTETTHQIYPTVGYIHGTQGNLIESLPGTGSGSWGSTTGLHTPFFKITTENPDTGAWIGGLYLVIGWLIGVDSDHDGYIDFSEYHIFAEFYIASTGGINLSTSTENIISPFTESDWYSIETEAWMHTPDSSQTFPYGPLTTDSRLGNRPFLWAGYTTDRDGTSTHAMVDYINWNSYTDVELMYRSGSYEAGIGYCKPRIDDVEDIMYASIENKSLSGSTRYWYVVAFDYNGNIVKKVQPNNRDATDSSGYWQSSTSGGRLYTVIFDIITVYRTLTRGIGVTNDHYYDLWYLFPYSSGLWARTRKCYVLRHDIIPPSGDFTLIYTHSDKLYVDAARGSPTVIYEYPASGAVVISGVHAGGNSHLLGSSFLNEWDSFTVDNLPRMPIFSVRAFDVIASGEFPPMESGVVGSMLNRYLGIAGGYEGIRVADSTLESQEYGTLKTFPGSGEVTQIDFTNFEEDPYIVTSIRGAGASGFFQRSPGSPEFVNVTSGLPSSEIMIIRIDDKV